MIQYTNIVIVKKIKNYSSVLQVGLWDCKDRQNFLKDEYAFHCKCTGCSEVNLSDIVLNAFHCVKPNCSGAVLESRVLECEKQKIKHFPIANKVSHFEGHLSIVNYYYFFYIINVF
jgi:hypothetical protein